LDYDHPADAESIGHHAKTGGPKRLTQRHIGFASIRQGSKHAMGFMFARYGEGKSKAIELRLIVAPFYPHTITTLCCGLWYKTWSTTRSTSNISITKRHSSIAAMPIKPWPIWLSYGDIPYTS
jgi:hypothetical protein